MRERGVMRDGWSEQSHTASGRDTSAAAEEKQARTLREKGKKGKKKKNVRSKSRVGGEMYLSAASS